MRIAYGGISCENTTFNPVLTRLSDFQIVRDLELPAGGRYPFLAHHDDVDFLPLLYASCGPGGPIDSADYRTLRTEFLDRLLSALPLDGLYLDEDCTSDVVIGYKLYAQVVARGAAAPQERDRQVGWLIPTGGAGTGNSPIPIGTASTIIVDCPDPSDLYLATSLVFESGFELTFLSENSDAVPCGD